jgi:hypothetical protein
MRSGVLFTTNTIMHALPAHSPIAVPTTPGIDISRSVCCLRTCSIVGSAARCSCSCSGTVSGPQVISPPRKSSNAVASNILNQPPSASVHVAGQARGCTRIPHKYGLLHFRPLAPKAELPTLSLSIDRHSERVEYRIDRIGNRGPAAFGFREK